MGGILSVVPVEFKRGKTKDDDVDRVQLMAQALCLEEMLGISVPRGQFYYLVEHRRSTVDLEETLRARTLGSIKKIRSLQEEGKTPPTAYEPQKCDRCSLMDLCMPKATGPGALSAVMYFHSQMNAKEQGS